MEIDTLVSADVIVVILGVVRDKYDHLQQYSLFCQEDDFRRAVCCFLGDNFVKIDQAYPFAVLVFDKIDVIPKVVNDRLVALIDRFALVHERGGRAAFGDENRPVLVGIVDDAVAVAHIDLAVRSRGIGDALFVIGLDFAVCGIEGELVGIGLHDRPNPAGALVEDRADDSVARIDDIAVNHQVPDGVRSVRLLEHHRAVEQGRHRVVEVELLCRNRRDRLVRALRLKDELVEVLDARARSACRKRGHAQCDCQRSHNQNRNSSFHCRLLLRVILLSVRCNSFPAKRDSCRQRYTCSHSSRHCFRRA